MKLLSSCHEFFRRVGVLSDLKYSHGLDIEIDNVCGYFNKERFEELTLFCLKNPDYHIISVTRNIYYNKPVSTADYYLLGEGDDDQTLVFILAEDPEIAFDSDLIMQQIQGE